MGRRLVLGRDCLLLSVQGRGATGPHETPAAVAEPVSAAAHGTAGSRPIGPAKPATAT